MLLLLAGLFASVGLHAQEVTSVCGNSTEDQLAYENRLLENLEKANSGAVSSRGAVQYVPIHFHLVGDAQGEGKVKERQILDQLCALNATYASMDIRFYLSPHPTKNTLFNYTINATNVYSNQNAWFTMQSNRHPNAIDIFIVDEAVSGNNNPGITLAYYSTPRDWIVSRRDRINGSGNNNVLQHEIGHFFSLMHTFLGWESNPFDSDDPGWPIASSIAPGGNTTERVNGTNCSTAADRICDTPPDYNFGLISGNCNAYTGGAKDPNGALVDPMENNIMGYFESCSDYMFTPQQQSVILADLASSARNYLDNNFSPVATEINTPEDLLLSPGNSETVPTFDEVLVEWKNLPEATYYLLEFDIVPTYGTPYHQAFIETGTSKLVTTLLANRTYYWRVRPFNEYVTCAAAKQRTLKTPATSSVRDIADLSAWQLAPNPVRKGDVLKIYFNAANSFDANVQIVNATGQLVFSQANAHFAFGENTYELPVNNLENGLYFVVLQTEAGQEVRKLSVLK